MITTIFPKLGLPAIAALALSVLANYTLAAPAPAPVGPPAAPPGWKLEVAAESPKIIDPTMLAVAPDGRVFIAQQTAAMENWQVKQPRDSIVVLHPDGRITTFASDLYNLFGLAYLDGKLFVTQWPKVTVFTDEDSVGKNPVDLFQTTTPEKGGYMQHIMANMRYAMDGYFYLTTGDRGIYKAVGTDGSMLTLHGGGVVRFRPDGSELEVYARGTRNNCDLALNAEDEIITLDNTDDGGGWNVRLAHLVDGGWYGYPYYYKPQSPFTLPCIADYGGGSPTGAIAYNEDALPEEYRGNFFMGEFGKRSLLRFRLQRVGATFAKPVREELINAKSGGSECRPIGLAWSPDGMSLYIADWNNSGWRQSRKVGRLLKLTYTGESLAAPKPVWWIPLAQGKPTEVSVAELMAGLNHPAQSVRLVAQRRLAERGTAGSKAAREVLADENAAPLARAAAIWTLDAIDGGSAAREQIIQVAANDNDTAVRAQAIRQLGTRRSSEAAPTLQNLLADSEQTIRFRAATALGRIGAEQTVPALTARLNDEDPFTRYAVFHALNSIGQKRATAWSAIAKGLESSDAKIVEGTLFAMRESYVPENVAALAKFVASPAQPESRAAALQTLAQLHRKVPAWEGKWWNNTPAKEPPPVKQVEWSGTPVVLAAVTAALSDTSPIVTQAALEAIVITRDATAAPALVKLFQSSNDLPTRTAVLTAVGAARGDASRQLIAELLADAERNKALLPVALAAAGALGDANLIASVAHLAQTAAEKTTVIAAIQVLRTSSTTKTIESLAQLLRHEQADIRAAAGEALGKIGGDTVLTTVLPLLDDPEVDVRRAAIVALAPLKKKQAQSKLVAGYADEATRDAALAALAQMSDPALLEIYLSALALAGPTGDLAQKTIDGMRDKVLGEIETRHAKVPLPPAVLARVQTIYKTHLAARKGPLMVGVTSPLEPKEYDQFARRTRGDAANGRALFISAKCAACHKADGQGGNVGPDLSSVAAKYGREQLIESVLYPSKTLLDGYQQSILVMTNGQTHTGLVRPLNDTEVQFTDPAGVTRTIAKADIDEQAKSNLSIMPDGQYLQFTPESFADLIAYLETLDDKPIVAGN